MNVLCEPDSDLASVAVDSDLASVSLASDFDSITVLASDDTFPSDEALVSNDATLTSLASAPLESAPFDSEFFESEALDSGALNFGAMEADPADSVLDSILSSEGLTSGLLVSLGLASVFSSSAGNSLVISCSAASTASPRRQAQFGMNLVSSSDPISRIRSGLALVAIISIKGNGVSKVALEVRAVCLESSVTAVTYELRVSLLNSTFVWARRARRRVIALILWLFWNLPKVFLQSGSVRSRTFFVHADVKAAPNSFVTV
mmetsp:Transcript_34561/g.55690  ORF Transcript_34561/g.55690 Transcript_34561/m.55690 type:complete len:261 (-) Transcript_34561:2538-3320(-)